MNSKDKTRQKLVGSMRKTKAAAGIAAEQAEDQTALVQAASVKTKQATSSAPVAPASGLGPDPYQCGRRVWPD